jgi:hypothetical protein
MVNFSNLRNVRRNGMSLTPILLVWGLMVAGGYFLITQYSGTPGERIAPPTRFPVDIQLKVQKDRPTLLVFIHPHCPCSNATLSELERLLADVKVPLSTVLLLGCPESERNTWTQSPLAKRCRLMSNASVVIDLNGELATHFNATTSGDCLLYSKEGALQFHGGITSGRGHEGESLGRVAIRKRLSGRDSGYQQTPVFGCELVGDSSVGEASPPCCQGVPTS